MACRKVLLFGLNFELSFSKVNYGFPGLLWGFISLTFDTLDHKRKLAMVHV